MNINLQYPLDIDKILDLDNTKNIYDKFIYLMFISGRRMAEIKEPKYLLKLNRGNANTIKTFFILFSFICPRSISFSL